MAWSLCSREEVMSIYKIDEASLHDFWSDTVESMIRGHLHAPYLGETPVTITEYHSGTGTSSISVNSPPITSVVEVSVDGSAYSPIEYSFYNTSILLTNSVFPSGTMNIKIVYGSGGTSVPKKVALTCAAMIAAIANYEGTLGADSSLKYADLPSFIGNTTPNRNIGLISHLQGIMEQMLSRYRLRIK